MTRKQRYFLIRERKNQDGFSLVQVMVVVGIIGGLAVFMMQRTDNLTKQQKTMDLEAEAESAATIIRLTLADKGVCDATFIGLSPGDTIKALHMSLDMSQKPMAQAGEKFKTFNVYIKDMYLLTRAEEVAGNHREASSDPIASYSTGAGTGFLRVTFAKQAGSVNGAKESVKIFPIKGYFYDVEIVKHNQEASLNEACWAKASTQGVSCNGTGGERCATLAIDEDGNGTDFIVDHSTGARLYLAECRYFRDDSPFMECAN